MINLDFIEGHIVFQSLLLRYLAGIVDRFDFRQSLPVLLDSVVNLLNESIVVPRFHDEIIRTEFH